MRHFGDIEGNHICITEHAMTRMLEMKISPEDFRALINDPDETFTSPKYPGQVNHRKGRYAMGLAKEGNTITVITVLYGSLEDWCEAAKNGELTDRTLRPNDAIPRRRRRDA